MKNFFHCCCSLWLKENIVIYICLSRFPLRHVTVLNAYFKKELKEFSCLHLINFHNSPCHLLDLLCENAFDMRLYPRTTLTLTFGAPILSRRIPSNKGGYSRKTQPSGKTSCCFWLYKLPGIKTGKCHLCVSQWIFWYLYW